MTNKVKRKDEWFERSKKRKYKKYSLQQITTPSHGLIIGLINREDKNEVFKFEGDRYPILFLWPTDLIL